MNVIRCSDQAIVATSAARAAHAILCDSQASGPRHVALTGGGTGVEITRALVALCAGAPCVDLHVWWGDERFVPRDNDARNDLQSTEAGLSELDIAPDHIHRVCGRDEATLSEAAGEYDRLLREQVAEVRGWPALDLVFLGVGEDGHVASLFPDHAWEAGEACVMGVQESPKEPPERVSLSMPVLCAAGTVILGVAGEGKADVLRRALEGDRSLPAGEVIAVRDARGMATLVYADEAALPR